MGKWKPDNGFSRLLLVNNITYMGTSTINTDKVWEMAKGTISLFGLNATWDFTNGLSKKQYIRKWERETLGKHAMYLQKNGRIIIPGLNIY